MTARSHGTRACYVHGPTGVADGRGCRCVPCRAANRDAERALKRSAAPPYVAADRARAHVRHLMAQGVGLKTVARRSGVAHGTLSKLLYGDSRRGSPPSKRVRPATESALLGVSVRDAADGARVDPTASIVNLSTLRSRGWTVAAIARATGLGRAALDKMPGTSFVAAGTARKIAALLDEPVPARLSRWGTHDSATWDPETDRRDRLRRSAAAEDRRRYRQAARQVEDTPPTLDLAALAAQEWRDRSACRLVPDDQTWIFWAPEADHRAMDACRKVCASCRVQAECLTNALANRESGFWGGHTEAERAELVALEATA